MTTETIDQDTFTLTADQQTALDAFVLFLMDPTETVFVLSGYSGCGKSTLVRNLLDQLPSFQKTVKLINPSQKEYTPELTATTNKAAENLSHITGMPTKTIHSFLGLRVQNDFRTNSTTLVPRTNFDIPERVLLFVDEASYIDKELLGMIFSRTRNSKVVFIGDPAQLAPIKATSTPVFTAGFTGAALTQVVRQAEGNPIVDLSTKFRGVVNTGDWSTCKFKPDGHHIQRLDRAEFNKAIEAEFTRTDWRYADSKILAWTNKCVIGYNEYVRNMAKGDPHFQVGDYAVCNSFLTVGRQSIKTDQLVQITSIDPDEEHHDVLGNWMTLDYGIRAFQPKTLASKNARIKLARATKEFTVGSEIETSWVDLRGAFACTINKAQGSTFGSVFVDLDDIARCNSGDQIARMLYVGVSRARNHVYLTGDLG
jgi:energy-coupling factor transporter ATP-binding protein EcfA2